MNTTHPAPMTDSTVDAVEAILASGLGTLAAALAFAAARYEACAAEGYQATELVSRDAATVAPTKR